MRDMNNPQYETFVKKSVRTAKKLVEESGVSHDAAIDAVMAQTETTAGQLLFGRDLSIIREDISIALAQAAPETRKCVTADDARADEQIKELKI